MTVRQTILATVSKSMTPTPWSDISKAISDNKKLRIKNWAKVRDELQSLINEGKVTRTSRVDIEEYI